MTRISLDSSKPILSETNDNSASARLSTYSNAPSTAFSEQSDASFPNQNGDSRAADMTSYASSLDRMDNKRLQDQRYVVSPQKEEDLKKLAFEGKVQKALDRRFSSQDAVMKPKAPLSEKQEHDPST